LNENVPSLTRCITVAIGVLVKDAVISMLHRDGTMLARYPHVEATIGRNLSTGQLFQTILPKSQHGTMRLDWRRPVSFRPPVERFSNCGHREVNGIGLHDQRGVPTRVGAR
jgi:hypothetical protein